MRDGWKFLLLFLQQVYSQKGCTLFFHDCDDWKFIIKLNEACMTFHGVSDITKWRVNSVDATSVTDPSCKFDPTPGSDGNYTLTFGVDACGNAESMSDDHKIWTAVVDNKDSSAGIYTSQKISTPFSCKYNKGHVVVSNEMAVSASQVDVTADTDSEEVQTDDLDAELILYDRKLECTGVGINRECTEAPEPGIEIVEGYVVNIGLDVRLQFKLTLEHKLDYCKVSNSDPQKTDPTVNRYLLRDGCLDDLGRSSSDDIDDQWIKKNQKNLEFKAFAFNEGADVFFKCQLHLCAGSYCNMPTFDQCSDGENNTALFNKYLADNGYAEARSLEMLDRKRRTIEISGRIPRVERQAETNSVAVPQDPTIPTDFTGSASMTPITTGGKKVSNKGVTMIVAGDMADRFESYKPINRPLNIYYGHEANASFQLVSSAFCSLAVAIFLLL